jgi:hypothetical protein
MTQKRDEVRAAPVVQLVIGLKRKAPQPTSNHNGAVTIDEFEREHMGIAAKE